MTLGAGRGTRSSSAVPENGPRRRDANNSCRSTAANPFERIFIYHFFLLTIWSPETIGASGARHGRTGLEPCSSYGKGKPRNEICMRRSRGYCAAYTNVRLTARKHEMELHDECIYCTGQKTYQRTRHRSNLKRVFIFVLALKQTENCPERKYPITNFKNPYPRV